jgi:hypothetical protein
MKIIQRVFLILTLCLVGAPFLVQAEKLKFKSDTIFAIDNTAHTITIKNGSSGVKKEYKIEANAKIALRTSDAEEKIVKLSDLKKGMRVTFTIASDPDTLSEIDADPN